MNKYADIVKNNLETLITELTENSHLYLKNPEKDFTRKRKLDFKEMIRLLLSMGGKSLNLELMEYFSYDVKTPTSSAFVQQRGKILPKAFETLFEKFTKSSGLSTLFCTTFIRSYLQDDILPESCIPKYCEYVYNCTIKHNFSTLYLTLLSF